MFRWLAETTELRIAALITQVLHTRRHPEQSYRACLGILRLAKSTPAAGPAALSSVVLLAPALYFSTPFSVPLHEFGILAAFGFIFALASVTLFGRRAPPAAGRSRPDQHAGNSSRDHLGGLLFAEIPGWLPILGGTIVMTVVAMTQILPVWSRS